MERVLQSTAPTIQARFYVDGVGTDPSPDTATVEITRADGTVLVASTAATNVAGVGNEGKFSFPLTTTHTALLDTLTAEWTSSLGTITTTVEVAGAFLFSLAQARAVTPLNDTTKYPTARLIEMRTQVEQAIEDVCGVAFVPRYALETHNGDNTTLLVLRWRRIRSVRTAFVDGTSIGSTELALVDPSAAGVRYPSRWASGFANVTVGYEHGYDIPPARISQAAILLAKRWLVAGPIDDRTTSMSTEDGTFSLATPGLRGSTFGIPEVDAAVDQYAFASLVG